MSRPVAAALALLPLLNASADMRGGPEGPPPPLYEPISAQAFVFFVDRPKEAVPRATEWVDAVLTHVPGEGDGTTARLSQWSPNTLRGLFVELASIRLLMRDPGAKVFPTPIEFDGGRPSEIRYSRDERRALDETAGRISRAGLTENDFMARAMVLHSDIALLGKATGRILQFSDGGRWEETTNGGDHWLTARLLADRLNRKALREADLALWYRATEMVMAAIQFLSVEHVQHGLERFPDDGDLLFLAGCLHENMGAPRTQATVASSSAPAGRIVRVSSAQGELSAAVSLFRKALEINPNHLEARLHYGRTLTLTGRAPAAVAELRRAVTSAIGRDQQYYAQLFLGDALESSNQRDAARTAYEAAAALIPDAQAPRLALSRMAFAAGERDRATQALEPMIALADDDASRRDPWWTYHTSHSRGWEELMAQARRQLVTPRK